MFVNNTYNIILTPPTDLNPQSIHSNTAAITRRVDEAKNLRSHYTLSLVMSTDVGMGVAAVPSITPRYICRPYQASLPTTSIAAPLGGMPRIAATYRVNAI